jgi:HK97 family phage portal protein
MGLISRLLGREAKATASTRYGTFEEIWGDLFGSGVSRTGVSVNYESALAVSTVLACTRRIAEGIMVPFKLYRREPDGRRSEVRDHPLYDVLTTKANEWQSSLELRETLAFHTVLAGEAFAFKNMVRGGVEELIPIEPGRVTVRRADDLTVTYHVTDHRGRVEVFPAEAIWHLRGPSWNGYTGMPALKMAREAVGLAIATEASQAEMHRNGVRPSGLLSVEGTANTDQLVRLAAYVKKMYAGIGETSRVMALDRSATFTPLQMTGVDSQHLETRKHQVEEICRTLGVLPIMVGFSDKTATYASSEQMFLAHLVHTVRPWHRRVEASADMHLLTKKERTDGLYTSFTDTEFLRAASKDRAEFMKTALGGGGNPAWVTPNEVRAWEELPPKPGGDTLYVPANISQIGPDGRLLPPPAATPKPAPTNGGAE